MIEILSSPAVTIPLSLLGGFLSAVVLVVKFQEAAGKIISWVVRLVEWLRSFFFREGSKRRYAMLAAGVEQEVNNAAFKLSRWTAGLVEHSVRLRLMRRGDSSKDLEEGALIILVDDHSSVEALRVEACLALSRRSVASDCVHLMREPLSQALHLHCARRLLRMIGDGKAVRMLSREDSKLRRSETSYNEYADAVEDCDEWGLLHTVFFPEVRQLKDSVGGKRVRESIFEAVDGLLDYLRELAIREYAEEVPLEYHDKYFSVAIIMMGKSKKMETAGAEPYKEAFRILTNQGFRHIFVMLADFRFQRQLQDLSVWIENEGLAVADLSFVAPEVLGEAPDGGAKCMAIVSRFDTGASASSQTPDDQDPQAELESILNEQVEEVRSGRVAVLRSARIPGSVSKIAIRGIAVGDADARTAIFKKKLAIERALGEKLWIIPFHDDPEKFILQSLSNNRPDDVARIRIDAEARQAFVTPVSREATARLIGTNRINVKLAMKLTNYYITIEQINDVAVEPRNGW